MENEMYGQLFVLSQENKDMDHTEVSGRVVIGRHADCDIQISKEGVANRHAVITMDENRKASLRPRRQVILNGVPLENETPVQLHDRDTFVICGKAFRWEYPKHTTANTSTKKPLSQKFNNEQNIPASPFTPKKDCASSPSNTPTPKRKRRSQKRRIVQIEPVQIEDQLPSIPEQFTVSSIPLIDEELSEPAVVVPSPQEEYERLKTELEASYRARELELEARVASLQKQVEDLTQPIPAISISSQAQQITLCDSETNTEAPIETTSTTHDTEMNEIKEQLLSWMTVSLKLEHLFRGEAVQPVDQEELLEQIAQEGIKFELWPAMILKKLMPVASQ